MCEGKRDLTKEFFRLFSACDNGQCNGNTCVCKPGFENRSGLCIPVCNPPCGKGNCTANGCECNRGYELDQKGSCIPKCTNGCDNGNCVAPEKCECHEGYILQNVQCTPFCPKWEREKNEKTRWRIE